MSRRSILIVAAALVVAALVIGISWYAIAHPASSTSALPDGPSVQPSSAGPAASASPSATATPSAQNPSPTGSPTLPGEPSVNPDALPRLPFDVILPASWSCATDTAGLGGLGYECANSSDPGKVTARLRLIWRACPDDCPVERQNLYSVDWQVAWYGEVRRFTPVDRQTATLETNSPSAYFSALSRFTKYDDSPYNYVVVVEGPPAAKPLLSAMVASIRTNAG
ncbi:hypothetical protein [Fodinicola feengrottensis]|uniref:DUF3558 domain-containing protein n=1 Tax=Fodinicola feengrottensis TaxID=435914 RepID=A0ABP4T125_9ACTN|nr:hypothetical protein [Fodinicola feengrottensis]